MRKPGFGEANLGALVGAVFGAVFGLFAVTIPYAIMARDLHALAFARDKGLIGFIVCAPLGWFIGGQIGPCLEGKLGERAGGILGGLLGGFLPVSGFLYWGWRLVHG